MTVENLIDALIEIRDRGKEVEQCQVIFGFEDEGKWREFTVGMVSHAGNKVYLEPEE